MKKTYAIVLLLAACAQGAACEPAGSTGHEESEPSDSVAPGDSPAPAPTAIAPAPDTAASPAPAEERPRMCTPPDPATAPPRRPPSEPKALPMSAEDTGEYDREVVLHPAIVDAQKERPLTREDHERIARQQRYLEAWRAAEASQPFASDEDRDSARAALKQQILGE